MSPGQQTFLAGERHHGVGQAAAETLAGSPGPPTSAVPPPSSTGTSRNFSRARECRGGGGAGLVERSPAPPSPLPSSPRPASFLSLPVARARVGGTGLSEGPLPYPCRLLGRFDPDWPFRSEQKQARLLSEERSARVGAKGRNLYNQLGGGAGQGEVPAVAQGEPPRAAGQDALKWPGRLLFEL